VNLAMRADRLWTVGGVLGAVALLAVSWFFLIGPQYDQTATLHDRTAAAQVRQASLQHRLIELRRQSRELPRFRTERALARQALPTTSAMSDYLRELEASGARTGVSVSGLIVGSPAKVAGPTEIYTVPITLTATGTAAELEKFLDAVQRDQHRATLISSANAVPDRQSTSLAGTVILTLGLQVYVAPRPASG
jgi:Tfp pilus assembly protein PilO